MFPIKLSLSHLVALVSPVIAVIAASLSTWLVVHIHFLALFHVQSSVLATAISQAVVWGVTAVGTFLMAHKVLGSIIELEKARYVPPPQAGQRLH